MRVEPKTEAEVSAMGLLPKGIYDFEVADATEKQSKAGNDMVELVVRVYDKDGKGRKVFDWLVSTDGSAYKCRHFAEATGMLAAYEKGNMPASDMIGRTGRCEVAVKKSEGYADKNSINDYLPAGVTGATNGAATPEVDEDGFIPF